jgi:hypothetical protein
MFLRPTTRKKDGKTHRTWSVVENRRVRGGRTVQHTVLYLGEINDSQREGWNRAIGAVVGRKARQIRLFPADREPPPAETPGIQVRMDRLELRRPRQWGGCWLAMELWDRLGLDGFWRPRLPPSREGTRWLNVLKTLVAYRLLDPGSEFRLHRDWYRRTAMADLLGEDFRLAAKDTLYRCLDRLLAHRDGLFGHLAPRWTELFGARHDVLLYDLTSTFFEIDAPAAEEDKRRHGYSRDRRPDCVQVVIGLVVTPEGFPLAYEVFAGNTRDTATLRDFLKRIEARHGKAGRIWVMDRGVPTEETLREMRESDPPVSYLVGTPKGRLSRLEAGFLDRPWERVRDGLEVKRRDADGDIYVLARSAARAGKERGIRRRKLQRLWRRLGEIAAMKDQSRDDLLMRLGAARKDAGRVWSLAGVSTDPFSFRLRRDRLREVRRREGCYLLRTNLPPGDPAELWRLYMRLSEVEQAFKELKQDLGLRPVYHRTEARIEAHIFVAFLAYALQVTLRNLIREHAGGLTPRRVLEQLAGIQMLDVVAPTTDGRWLTMSRFTQPERSQQVLLARLGLALPPQPPPRIHAAEPPPPD